MTEGESRFLFVDDDEHVLEGIENLLFDAPDEWQIDYALGGAEAIRVLDDTSYDVLITDMRMPGVDGLCVLRHAVQRRPEMTRVALSGHVEEEVAQEAMGYVHEFLSKPCKEEMLLATMRRCAALATGPMQRSFKEAVGMVGALPSRPKTHQEALALLDRGGSLEDLAELVGGDMAISTKVLHVANTAFYSRGHRALTVLDAVRRLGAATTAVLILGVETYETIEVPDWLDLEEIHAHGLAVGMLAAALAAHEIRADALLGGLLHDVGELVLAYSFPRQGERARNLVSNGVDPLEAEQRVLGFAHPQLGAHLLRLWNLDERLATAIEQHHTTGVPDREPVSMVLFAAAYACHYPESSEKDAELTEAELAHVTRGRGLRTDAEQVTS